MSTLKEYLGLSGPKAVSPRENPKQLKVSAKSEDRSGIHRIRVCDFQVIRDSDTDFAGYVVGHNSFGTNHEQLHEPDYKASIQDTHDVSVLQILLDGNVASIIGNAGCPLQFTPC